MTLSLILNQLRFDLWQNNIQLKQSKYIKKRWDALTKLYSKEIQPINPKGNQPWIFMGRTDAEAETPILWPPDAKKWLTWKDRDAEKDRRCEKKGTTEDEMVGWHHRLNRHGFGWAPAVGDGQGGLAYCGLWVAKSQTRLSDWTEPNLWLLMRPLICRSGSVCGFLSHSLEDWWPSKEAAWSLDECWSLTAGSDPSLIFS